MCHHSLVGNYASGKLAACVRPFHIQNCKNMCLSIKMTTIRPRDEYHNRQSAYYNSDLHRQQQPFSYHHLRLIWDEHGTDIEYTLRYNTSRPGFWLASEPQRGVMLQINHSSFAGTVQVMKAVGDHMVLTFCEGLPGSKLFSIVLSRRPDTLSYDVSSLFKFCFFLIFYCTS